MTRTDWLISTFAGAAFGGIFWAIVPLCTSVIDNAAPPNAAFLTVAISIAAGLAGTIAFRLARHVTVQRIGAAVTIGAVIGLPVLGWFALWQNMIR